MIYRKHTHKNTFTLETFIAIMQLILGEKMHKIDK